MTNPQISTDLGKALEQINNKLVFILSIVEFL